MSWNDFNSADDQREFDIIPKGTLAKVRMTIKPGGYDDPSQGWTGGYATHNDNTGSIYLNCEFVVLEGEFARRKCWSLIGLHSEKGPEWSNMGRAFIKGILNSARMLKPDDNSPQAQQARRIQGLHELDGIEFLAKIGVDKDQYGEPKNSINIAIGPDHKDYGKYMSVSPQPNPQAPPAQASTAPPTGRPSWAQ